MVRTQSTTVQTAASPIAWSNGRPRRQTAGAIRPNTTADDVHRSTSETHAIVPKRRIQ